MGTLTELGEINYLAVLVAAVVAFGIGAIWYAPPVLGKTWMRLTGRTEEDAAAGNVPLTMGLGFVTTLIGVFALALFLGPDAGVGAGLVAGLVAGVGIGAMAVALNGLFEERSPLLIAINSGYQVVIYVAAGVILGLW